MTRLTATVAEVQQLGPEIKSFRFEAPDTPFTNASAGAHVDVYVPNGLLRQYSLWDWADDGSSISVGVKGEPNGGGGSKWLHENLTVGSTIELGDIRNNFKLDEAAKSYLLIAGGIGVTPMVAMGRRALELGKNISFYYLARNAAAAGFTDILSGLGLDDDLHLHHDDKDGLLDIKGLLDSQSADTQVYFCGPEALLSAVLDHTKDWPPERVHFERFSGDPTKLNAPSEGFEVELRQTGETFHIPEDMSILDVLLEKGLNPEFGCMDGVCGSCTTTVIEGEVEHRDATMTAEEHDEEKSMCICVSRAKGDKLVLDL